MNKPKKTLWLRQRLGSWGGNYIFGDAFGPVVEAIERAAGKGIRLRAPTLAEKELGQLFVVSSGSSIDVVSM